MSEKIVKETVFKLLSASLFTNESVELLAEDAVLDEMKEQTVAALPGEWLKNHYARNKAQWSAFCDFQRVQWIRVMYGQEQLLKLFNDNHMPCVIIKGAAAAMYYPHPDLRTMGDVDVLVKREDIDKAAGIMESNGYSLTYEKDHVYHHYNYEKDRISFELHRRLPVILNSDERRLVLFEEGIDNREWHETEGFRFPTLPKTLNGLVLIFHIEQHLREGLGLRQIIDWMMFVNSLNKTEWQEMVAKLRETGMERLAFTVTAMCQKHLGLRHIVEEDSSYPCEELLDFIMEKGNFGRKAGLNGKTEAFSLSATERGGFFRRLQSGGLGRWKAAKKYPFLRPFAWIYQTFRIIGELKKSGKKPKEIMESRKRGIEQRKLIEALGLDMDRTVHEKH